MSDIDRQRLSAVQKLQELGLVWRSNGWQGASDFAAIPEADAMHAILVAYADELDGYTEGSPEEAEYLRLVEAIEAYEAKRWPQGRLPLYGLERSILKFCSLPNRHSYSRREQ